MASPRSRGGDVAAQHNLGVMYAEGKGTAQDDAKVIEWARRAAEAGNAIAQANLGLMYRDGKGGCAGFCGISEMVSPRG